MAEPLGSTKLLVLRDLRRTRPVDLLRTAVKQLVAEHVYEVDTTLHHRVLRGPVRTPVLRPGTAEPCDPVLREVHRRVLDSRVGLVDGRPGRLVADVARHLATQKGHQALLDRALQDLSAEGLVTSSSRRVLRVFTSTSWTRTAEGDGALARTRPTSSAAEVDRALARGFARAELDRAWDSGFDAAFDACFDGGFDACGGGSDGGGDGGGGGD